jgi:hypothetical protein
MPASPCPSKYIAVFVNASDSRLTAWFEYAV